MFGDKLGIHFKRNVYTGGFTTRDLHAEYFATMACDYKKRVSSVLRTEIRGLPQKSEHERVPEEVSR